MTPLLSTHSLSYAVGGAHLVDDVTFAADRGELLAVAGPNGAGKTTLLRLLAGEIAPSSGEVRIEGQSIEAMRPAALARLRAVLPQQTPTTFRFTAREVVGFARMPWLGTPTSAEDEEAVDEAMRLTEVDHLSGQAFPTLSGGEQTRVSVARVMAQRTPLLLFDEPTSALDLRHQELVMELLRCLAMAGRAVVAVVHDLNLASIHASRIGLMRDGRLAACGAPAEILNERLLSEVFGHPVRVIEDPKSNQPLVLPDCRTVEAAGQADGERLAQPAGSPDF